MSDTLTVLRPVLAVVAAGRYPLNVTGITADFDVNSSVGTATIDVIPPMATAIAKGTAITVTAGFENGQQGVIFAGTIKDDPRSLDQDGPTIQLRAEGNGNRLRNGQEDEILVNHPDLLNVSLTRLFRSMLAARGVSPALVDTIRFYDPSVVAYPSILIGMNPYVGRDSTHLAARTSWLSWIQAKATMFGYRAYDTPAGTFRISRVSGTPPNTPVATFIEGENILSIRGGQRTSDLVNWWTVWGARYLDQNGIAVQIRNSPASVPFSTLLNPPGYRHEDFRDSWIVSLDNAIAVRAIKEIDFAAPSNYETLEVVGQPLLQPGEPIRVVSPSTNLAHATNSLRWVIGLNHRVSDGEFITTIDTWSGAGMPLPSANDCSFQTLTSGTYHLGDQPRPNFRVPGPFGTTVTFPVTIASTYTSMSMHGLIHGSNHGVLTSSTHVPRDLSRVEMWQGGNRISSVDLPVYTDSFSRDYSDGETEWQNLNLPISGSLAAGAAELRIIAGEDVDLQETLAFDDFEVRTLQLRTCGVGNPVLPT